MLENSKDKAEKIFEKYRGISRNAKYAVLKVSPRKYAVIKQTVEARASCIGAPKGKLQCLPEFEFYSEGLAYKEACSIAVTMNEMAEINVLIDEREMDI
jgi:hypothetical protein